MMLFKTLVPLALLGVSAFALPLEKRAFVQRAYADFQISDGVGGDAQALANAVFVTPFQGVDLSTVSKAQRDAVEAMRQEAEAAETDKFNPQIAAASGANAAALQVGKIKNKVLKLTGIVQVSKIDLAIAKKAGKSTSSITAKMTEEQTKLTKNIATDKESKGKPSKGVA